MSTFESEFLSCENFLCNVRLDGDGRKLLLIIHCKFVKDTKWQNIETICPK